MKQTALFRLTSVTTILFAFLTTNLSQAQQNTYWWNDVVFYEIFVRSFYDSNDDGIGDLQGLIQKLDYLNDGDSTTTSDLGINGIWLMPISESPSYHGYDVTDYRSVERDYGTLQDFQALMDSSHARGIYVIIDLVLNHSSNFHPWFVNSASSSNSPYRDWYIWSNSNPGYSGPWGQQVWHSRNGAYYFALFWSGMPDLNFSNADLKNEMFEVVRFWLSNMNVDGFRLDAIKHLFEAGTVMENVPATFDFLQEFRQFYKSIDAQAMAVGEVWSETNQIAPYVDGTKVDFCFEFPLSSAILSAVISGQSALIDTQIKTVLRSYPYLQYATFLTNHDIDRVFGLIGENLDKMKLAAAVYLTLPGTPFIYYGEEIAMLGSGRDENKRTPMQWSDATYAGFSTSRPWYDPNSNYASFNVQKMQADSTSLWQWYRKLIAIRNKYAALRRGDYVTVGSNVSNLYAYARRTNDEVILALHNFRNQSVNNPSLTLSNSSLSSGEHAVYDLIAGGKIGSVSVELGGGFTNWASGVQLQSQGTALLRIDPASTQTSVESIADSQPEQYALGQNFPNPFNPRTTIPFSIPEPAYVSIKVFNALGEEMATLVEKSFPAGEYRVTWEASGVASGIYFCRMQAGAFVETRKLEVLQ